MMFLRELLAVISCFGFGALSSAGIFTVFVTVGLVPRLADKTHTANHIEEYETAIVWGAVMGCLLSLFPFSFGGLSFLSFLGEAMLLIFGLFAGMFVGCFAIAIAEMLNTIPIFSRRISMGAGMGIVLLFMALGKSAGALFYFFFSIG